MTAGVWVAIGIVALAVVAVWAYTRRDGDDA